MIGISCGRQANWTLAAAAVLAVLSSPGARGLDADLKPPVNSSQWPTYNNGYKGQRFSPLAEITARNVSKLEEVCRVKVASGGSFQTGPVIVDRTMYLTTVLDTLSIDPTNCRVRWKSSHELEQGQVWAANRGAAVMNGRIFRGTVDGRLLALDAKTGALIWKDIVGDPTLNEFVPSAPLAWNGLVITGTSGSDLGIKGRILAFDALSGREVWRFNTIPTGDEAGAETWERRQSAAIGGGGTWSSFALDVISGEIFVPVGNPAPTNAPDARPGANLFTDSLVVLDARTGALKWWYQLAPNDALDYDLGAAPMLYTNSEGEDVVAVAGKDGYVHVIDRLTRRVLFKSAVTTIENAGVRPSEEETRVCPGGLGGTQWNGPALDPTSRTLFVGAIDWCSMIKTIGETRFIKSEGRFLHGATTSMIMNPPPSGWISALDSDTGMIKWKYHAAAPIVAGVTPTAGGIVLTGDTAGTFLILESATGQVLLRKDTGGAIAGGVVTYAVDGKQYIALTSGSVSRSSLGTIGVPTIVILALNAAARTPHARSIEHGRTLYAQNCAACHGASGEGGTGKSLTKLSARRTFQSTIQWLENPTPPMPKLFPSPLSERDVRDIALFIRSF
jgi:alcohol dehydrogenase (cytochrome c)